MASASKWWSQVKAVFGNPKKFFSSMPTTGGYTEPLIFFTINTGISLFLSALLAIGLRAALGQPSGSLVEMLTVLIGIPLAALLIFLGAAIVHLLLKLFRGKGSYEATFRVMSYTSAASLLSWIPIVNIAVGIYAIYLELVGFSHVHKIGKWRVFAAIVLLPLLIGLAIAGIIYYQLAAQQSALFGDAQNQLDQFVGNST